MNSTNDKIKGNANTAVGSVKSAIGNLTGSKKLRAEAEVQTIKGKAQKASGAAKEALKKAGDKMRHMAD